MKSVISLVSEDNNTFRAVTDTCADWIKVARMIKWSKERLLYEIKGRVHEAMEL
tara:strand:- start:16761 stop:16922 length:162 start_codon:yes stop_codon:yes gene_type:complete